MLAPLVAGIVALIAIAAGAWYFLAGNRFASLVATNPRPAHLSIVVLPFTNLSGDPNQDYFADGITENLTTDLSRIRNSFVIARNTAFTFKGKSIDAKEIGKELGVRYVLEGSVQRDGTRVRVNAQLIDAETGAHLWADRFEEDVSDLFKLQDQVVARLANALNYELVRAEAETGAHAKNPDVIDLDMRGHEALWRFFQQPTKDSLISIRALFEQALKIDPNDADALGDDATTYLNEYSFGWTNPDTDYEAKILGQADRAIALTPHNPWNLLDEKRVFDKYRTREGGAPRRRRRDRDQSKLRLRICLSQHRRDCFGSIRTSKIRHATSHAPQSTRSQNGPVARLHGVGRSWARALRRRNRGSQQGDRRRI